LPHLGKGRAQPCPTPDRGREDSSLHKFVCADWNLTFLFPTSGRTRGGERRADSSRPEIYFRGLATRIKCNSLIGSLD